jgi:uncharacterized C2H2 Zn-finger protein
MAKLIDVTLTVTMEDSELYSTIRERISDALENSDNLASNKLVDMRVKDLPTVELDDDDSYVHITCPSCEMVESRDINHARHKLSEFNLIRWLSNEDEVECSYIKCRSCGQGFKQLWNYTKEEDLEVVEWYYACTTHVIWGDFDCGTVWARTEEEAMVKAKEEVSNKLEEINKRLEGLTTLEVDLNCLEVNRDR